MTGDRRELAAVFAGGGGGAPGPPGPGGPLAPPRGAGPAVAQRAGRALPFGTFAVNLSGALVLGVLAGAAVRGHALLLAGTATIGSYTTFSTWMLESQRLGEDGERGALALNLAASLACGL